MSELYYPDWQIRRVLRDTNVIAMVGASTNWNRPSYFAMSEYVRPHSCLCLSSLANSRPTSA